MMHDSQAKLLHCPATHRTKWLIDLQLPIMVNILNPTLNRVDYPCVLVGNQIIPCLLKDLQKLVAPLMNSCDHNLSELSVCILCSLGIFVVFLVIHMWRVSI